MLQAILFLIMINISLMIKKRPWYNFVYPRGGGLGPPPALRSVEILCLQISLNSISLERARKADHFSCEDLCLEMYTSQDMTRYSIYDVTNVQ